MGESELTRDFRSEAEFVDFASQMAQRLRAAACHPLLVGLCGALGTGKTTWTRALLRGLGYRGRVPSPTYTLLEQYACDGLSVVHLDLYRLAAEAELENLGLRDWLAQPATWLLVEWVERAPRLAAACDLALDFTDLGDGARRVVFSARTAAGIHALQQSADLRVN